MMKPLIITASTLSVILTLFGGAKAYDRLAFGPANLKNGEALYTAHCRVCHGAKGHGDGALAAHLEISADNIAEELANPFGFKVELVSSVYNGDNGQQGQMPAFRGTLTKEDINDALEYVRTLNTPDT